MAFSLNKVMLIGNLGRDAETRFTPNNLSVSNFSIAVSRSFKGKDDQWQNETTWINIVAYNLSDYYKTVLRKGKKVYIEGRLSIREYTDRDGIKKFYTEVISEKIIPLDAKDTGEEHITDSSRTDNYHNSVDLPPSNPKADDDGLPF
ncbi:MAG TPA: single-stranded DNA-binding protein [Melioribacteraceae bacterium]|nr:single-stranded DNA-binding protein [Melioribacteraceae bacterium]